MNKAVCLALLGLITATCAQAADQSLSVPTAIEHDTNPRMTAAGSSALTRYRLIPQYNWQWQRERDAVTLSGRLLLERSSDTAQSQNRHDPSLDGSWQRETAFGSFSAKAGFRSESSRVAALTENGQLVADATRFTRTYGGQYAHTLSEFDTLSVDLSGQDVNFTQRAQVDYKTASIGLRYARKLSEVLEASASATASRYSADKTTAVVALPNSRNHGLTLGLRYQLASTLDVQGQTGVLFIPAGSGGSASGRTLQGSLSFSHQGERLSSTLSASRSASVSASGGYAISDSLRIQESYALTEDTQVGVQASHQRTGGTLPSQARSAGIDLNHRLAENWRLSINVQRREVESANLGTAAGALIGAQLVFTEPHF
jgi:hypothetical protein